ncbi:hypothetical protein BGX26_011926 [Mortierella sp. AD094]|nr:hypothetical protein BGX26_011926 [Mortierella sp. AD094]
MLDRDIFYGRSVAPLKTKVPAKGHDLDDGSIDSRCDDPDENMDEDEDEINDGEQEEPDEDADIPKRRHLILLAHLRKVVLQDAVAIIAQGENDAQCLYAEHHIFHEPVFKTQLFFDFQTRLREQMKMVDLTLAAQTELSDARKSREDLDYSMQSWAATQSRSVNGALRKLRDELKEFRDISNDSSQMLCRLVSRIASQIHTIAEDEALQLSQISLAHRAAPLQYTPVPEQLQSQPTLPSAPSVEQNQVPTPQLRNDLIPLNIANLNTLMDRIARTSSSA